MKIGILGGTFDPVHCAHLQIAKIAADAKNLDRVLFIPTGHPPHKLCPFASGAERLEMLNLAGDIDCRFMASDIEIARAGTTYTVETLEELKRRCPGDEFFYIIGTDTLSVLDKWRRFEDIAKLCSFIVLKRPGADVAIDSVIARLGVYGARFSVIEFEAEDISSTQLREMASEGKPLFGFVPEKVEQYINDRGMYDLAKKRGEIDRWLKENLSERRCRHTMGVEHCAVDLAEHYGADRLKASFAALLHDCAKEFSPEKQVEYARRAGVEPDELMLASTNVIHGFAAAGFARETFAIDDGEILNAAAVHTMGSARMSLLEKIIYLADYIEPGRKYVWVDELRKIAYDDIDAACFEATALTIAHVIEGRGVLHPQTLETYNSYLLHNRRKSNGE